MARCMQCGKELTHNEIGAHRKFINRGAEQFFCKRADACRFCGSRLGMADALIFQINAAGLLCPWRERR